MAPMVSARPPATPNRPASAASSAAGPSPLPSASAASAFSAEPVLPLPATPVRVDVHAIRTAVHELQQKRFWSCHTQPPATVRASAKRKPRGLLQRWITPAESTDVVLVAIWDTELGTNESQYTSFHVLGWNDTDTVVGASSNGGAHLRILPTAFLPGDTLKALHRVCGKGLTAAAPEWYEESAFAPATFVRPTGSEEEALLITDGPLKKMACSVVRDTHALVP